MPFGDILSLSRLSAKVMNTQEMFKQPYFLRRNFITLLQILNYNRNSKFITSNWNHWPSSCHPWEAAFCCIGFAVLPWNTRTRARGQQVPVFPKRKVWISCGCWLTESFPAEWTAAFPLEMWFAKDGNHEISLLFVIINFILYAHSVLLLQYAEIFTYSKLHIA